MISALSSQLVRSPRVTDPDLFTPSLDASHDTDGIDRPWSPTALLFITFFCGITAGGVLIALNYKRQKAALLLHGWGRRE